MKKDNKNKENKTMKFLDIIKKKWLINGTSTILLIAILIAVFILLNSIIKSFDISPIDCTSNKEYSLTDTSKDKIKGVGGLPYGMNGSTMLMLSGGIDSPVAGYLMA